MGKIFAKVVLWLRRSFFHKNTMLWGLLALVIAAASSQEYDLLKELYHEAKREIEDFRLSSSLETVTCPRAAFVVLALGQSNAGNHLGSRVPRNNNVPAFAYFRGQCVAIEDPVPGATGLGGSLWSQLAQELTQRSGQPTIVIAGAVGGSVVRDWSEDRQRLRSRVMRSVLAAVRDGLAPNVVIWVQGESDALAATPAVVYELRLKDTIKQIDAQIAATQHLLGDPASPPLWFVTQTSKCKGEREEGSAGVREAQRAVAVGSQRVSLGPDTDLLGDPFRRDGCHFNSAGRNRIVRDLVHSLLKIGGDLRLAR